MGNSWEELHSVEEILEVQNLVEEDLVAEEIHEEAPVVGFCQEEVEIQIPDDEKVVNKSDLDCH